MNLKTTNIIFSVQKIAISDEQTIQRTEQTNFSQTLFEMIDSKRLDKTLKEHKQNIWKKQRQKN